MLITDLPCYWKPTISHTSPGNLVLIATSGYQPEDKSASVAFSAIASRKPYSTDIQDIILPRRVHILPEVARLELGFTF